MAHEYSDLLVDPLSFFYFRGRLIKICTRKMFFKHVYAFKEYELQSGFIVRITMNKIEEEIKI